MKGTMNMEGNNMRVKGDMSDTQEFAPPPNC